MSNLVVLKIGGSVITDKKRENFFRQDVMARIAKEIARCWPTPLVIIHGAGSFGHPVAKQYSVDKGYREQGQLEGFVKTLQSVKTLNQHVVNTLIETGIGAVGMPASTLFITRKGIIETAHLDLVLSALDLGVIPVTCGDAVFDRELKFTVLSGDQIAIHLAKSLKASRIVFASDVDGVYDVDRETGEKRLLDKLDYRKHTTLLYGGVEGEDITGGMFYKVENGFEAVKAGAEVVIVNGLVEGRIEAAVKGKPVTGTTLVM
ncbi:acetylglutamate kinase [Candidatus Caldarchaeum subterraneum]|uniref:Isopentenyl phosphate kinase n=2 Tax=Caldiarchaeum subterraneum TaxID=311458 RepID=E6N578_CALS0|nr:acetylglutamate kinase [Candidatus Caldarchaeum subterraneum]BAJ50286.1 acetylglutamate kinase [Candidatus Caldarchaeum subterraneum]GBC72311.1 Acetylglutamate kinase [archaeon HR03]